MHQLIQSINASESSFYRTFQQQLLDTGQEELKGSDQLSPLRQMQVHVIEGWSALRTQEVSKRDRKRLWLAVPSEIDSTLKIYKGTVATS